MRSYTGSSIRTVGLAVLLLGNTSALFTSNPSSAQHLKVRLVEELVIGDDESKPAEYLLGGPQHVGTDSHGNIYIADYPRVGIQVFDQEGLYLTTIGKRGQGPGEIQQVTSMLVDANDDVLIVDRMNLRVTRFSERGARVEMHPLPAKSSISPTIIRPLGQKQYALYYRILSSGPRGEVIHLYGHDFATVEDRLAPLGEVWDLDVPFERAIAGNPRGARMATFGADRVFIAPYVYDGVIYRYDRQGEGWRLTKMQGKKLPFAPYKLQPTKRGSYPKRAAWRINGPGWRFVATIRSSSRGLFALQDGSLVHFTTQFEGKDELDDNYFGVEVFDPNGVFIGSGPVQNMEPFDKDERSIIEVLWCDKEDRFYLTDHRNDFPVLRVMRLEYEVED